MVQCFDDMIFLILRVQSGVVFDDSRKTMVSKRRPFRAHEVHFNDSIFYWNGLRENFFFYLFFQECFINNSKAYVMKDKQPLARLKIQNLNISAMMEILLRFMEMEGK